MCLSCKKGTPIRVATKNIPVWKVIKKDGRGIFNQMYIKRIEEKWTPGFEYTETTFKKTVSEKRKYLFFPNYNTFGIRENAFHSYVTINGAKARARSFSERIIVKMYIPMLVKLSMPQIELFIPNNKL